MSILISTLYCIYFSDCTANFTLIGNGVCNDETNNPGCFYDGGDCCVNTNTDHCTECICYHKENCAAGFTPSIVGNGFCNDGTNNAECNYDGGDCCGYGVNTGYCSDCKCYLNETCIAGTHPLVGDGFCNDETNNADCDYDGGDCCGSCVLNNQCTECACLGGADVINALIGNGFCNDEFNNADCYYDGGDCCKSKTMPWNHKYFAISYFQANLGGSSTFKTILNVLMWMFFVICNGH